MIITSRNIKYLSKLMPVLGHICCSHHAVSCGYELPPHFLTILLACIVSFSLFTQCTKNGAINIKELLPLRVSSLPYAK